MDFNEVISKVDETVLDELQEAAGGRESYESHVMDGLHEALDFRMSELLADVLDENLQAVYRTMHHLLAEDPDADDPAAALYGTMLAEANMNAAVRLSRFIRENEEPFRNIIEEVVEETVERFENADFESFYEEEDDEEDDDYDWMDVDVDDDDDDDIVFLVDAGVDSND